MSRSQGFLCSLVSVLSFWQASNNVFASALPFTRRSGTSWQDNVGPHAQCMARITPSEKAEFHHGLLQARSLRERGGVYERDLDEDEKFKFGVAFNIVYANKTRDGGWIPDEDIEAQMKVLNQDYSNAGISWFLVNTTRIANEDWFVHAGPGTNNETAMKTKYHVGDATVLNVYTLTFNSSTASLGSSSIPSNYFREPVLDGVMVRHGTITNGPREGFNMGRTLVHEVGHWLGLLHTFEGGCDDQIGDNVADTPPQASGSEGCPKGRDSCPGDGPDLINNFMDYSDDACMDSFTPGQIARMKEAIRAFRRPHSTTEADVKASASASKASVSATAVVSSASVAASGSVIGNSTEATTTAAPAAATAESEDAAEE